MGSNQVDIPYDSKKALLLLNTTSDDQRYQRGFHYSVWRYPFQLWQVAVGVV